MKGAGRNAAPKIKPQIELTDEREEMTFLVWAFVERLGLNQILSIPISGIFLYQFWSKSFHCWEDKNYAYYSLAMALALIWSVQIAGIFSKMYMRDPFSYDKEKMTAFDLVTTIFGWVIIIVISATYYFVCEVKISY
jgi:hypothetical protein